MVIRLLRLCDVRFTTVKADLNLEGVTVNSRTGDYNPSSLAEVVNAETINELVVRTWIDRACALIIVFYTETMPLTSLPFL